MQLRLLDESSIWVNDVRVVSVTFNAIKPDTLRAMGDKIKEKAPRMVAVIASITDGKGTMLAACGKEAVAKGANAGTIIREIAALAGGKGGGRPDSAMAAYPKFLRLTKHWRSCLRSSRSSPKKMSGHDSMDILPLYFHFSNYLIEKGRISDGLSVLQYY